MRMEPASDNSLSASRLDEIVGVCDRFEAAWRAGAPRAIETELEGVEEERRSCLLGQLVALEVGLRRERGECPSMQEYFARFPGRDDLVQGASRRPTRVIPRRFSIRNPTQRPLPTSPSGSGVIASSDLRAEAASGSSILPTMGNWTGP